MNNPLRCVIIGCAVLAVAGCGPDLAAIKHTGMRAGGQPPVHPDYRGVTIPPNIAPLNFTLRDHGTAAFAEISSVNGPPFIVRAKGGSFRIDAAKWKRLLAANAEQHLRITLSSRDRKGVWRTYDAIETTIAAEPIDRYCTYRLLSYQYNYSSRLRECQRDLTTFDEKVLVDSRNFVWGCVNCHLPLANNPRRFVMQVRSTAYGSETLIAHDDSIATLSSRLGHAAWHPGGRYIAFTVYKVEQYFHSTGRQFIDVYDRNSSIVLFDAVERRIVPSPPLERQGMLDTWPAWSPDGRHLYFCSAPVPWDDSQRDPPEHFNRTQYSLCRLAFDGKGTLGAEPDTVLSASTVGMSIAQPKISPDGRYCLFCMQNYGAYPHAQVTSDLYLMNLANGTYQKLPINSDYHESWHSWSTNSRWILFSSKRGTGIFTRLYLSHLDSAGNASTPMILPQADGAFYDSFTDCYNVPELAVAPVRFSERQLLGAIRSRNRTAVPLPQDSRPSDGGTVPAWGSIPVNSH